MSLFSIACVKNNSVNTASGNTRVIDYRKIVKIRTIQHIKKYGLKAVLINKEIKWWGPEGAMTLFKNDRTGHYNYRDPRDKIFYWKVVDGKLYINPNKQLSNGNKFVLVKVEPEEAFGEDIKFALLISTIDDSFNFGIVRTSF